MIRLSSQITWKLKYWNWIWAIEIDWKLTRTAHLSQIDKKSDKLLLTPLQFDLSYMIKSDQYGKQQWVAASSVCIVWVRPNNNWQSQTGENFWASLPILIANTIIKYNIYTSCSIHHIFEFLVEQLTKLTVLDTLRDMDCNYDLIICSMIEQ